jgi:hypothetical protein
VLLYELGDLENKKLNKRTALKPTTKLSLEAM